MAASYGAVKARGNDDSTQHTYPPWPATRAPSSLYHAETDGNISPIPKERQTSPFGVILLKGGTRSWLDLPDINKALDGLGTERSTMDKKDLLERRSQMLSELRSTFLSSNHICTTNCLLQSSILRVSSQTRAETLDIYGKNKFHIEMQNFISYRISPREWWQAIEDANVHLIKALNLCIGGPTGGIMVECRQGQPCDAFNSTLPHEFFENEDRIRETLRAVEIRGLSVAALEQLLGWLKNLPVAPW